MSFTASCGSPQYAASEYEYVMGFQCTISFGDVLLLPGIAVLFMLIGFAALKDK